MVFSKKSFLYSIVALIAFLPSVLLANSPEPTQHEGTAAATENLDPEAKIRAQIDEVKSHHVLDSHSFNFFADDVHYYCFRCLIKKRHNFAFADTT